MAEGIGERIKILRIEQGLTLAELGESVSLSPSHLSQIEREKTAPSLSTLLEIAKALNVDPRYFFEIETNVVHIERAKRGPEESSPQKQIEYFPLTPRIGNWRLDVYRIVFQPHTQSEKLDLFSGEEFSFVLYGELMIHIGNEQIILCAGDSIHYDANQPHEWGNYGDQPCIIIWGRAPSLQ
ncbi:MAG TPA: XRE family transcriptional regulator [Anaerolineaceae bacterium]|nr:XRE family transcriptional regulator [Anaerolineaceae bacterium]